MLKEAAKIRKKIGKDIYEGENTEEYSNFPLQQVDLNVLAVGENYCLLKDEVSKDIFSVEKGPQGIILVLIMKGNK